MGINVSSFQSGNISERLSDLRSGIQGISLAGFSFKSGSFTKSTRETPIMLASAGFDPAGMLPSGMNERWGIFIKGNALYGDQKDTSDHTGYDFTGAGVTIGSDYRFTKSLIAGMMLGFNTSRANVDNRGSKVKMDGYTFGTYATYYKKGFFIDGQLSYSISDYDNTRRIVFPGLDRTATSSPKGSQVTIYSLAGYDIKRNRWTLTPNASLQYVRLAVDSYTEAGAGALNLEVDRQNLESLQGSMGAKLSYTWHTGNTFIMPHIRASYGYEFKGGSQNVTSRLAQGSSPFSIETISPDRSFLNLGCGITILARNNTSLYAGYNAQIGEGTYIAHSVNLGLRVGF